MKHPRRLQNTLVRCWRRRPRAARALALPLLALLLALGEPLLCVAHCQIWLPLQFSRYFASQHSQHHHLHGTPAPGPGHAADRAAECQMRGDAGVPAHMPQPPVHDLVLALLVLVPLATLVRRYAAALAQFPALVFFPPLRRPPRPQAG
ncbi:MAG TPA: hypothetical protein PKK15_24665 [Kouleothrix sp.]|uniref:hypothetical protein n=1 Tax=Kouleothrix sp. TaxID=2779161 RepID=UPI002B91A92D|nr:hypothetical protein [Kouleothrix sp.]